MQIEVGLLVIALLTSLSGSLVRAFYEINNKTHNRTKLLFIVITSIAIGFVNYEVVTNLDIRQWAGVFGVVGGLVGISLVKSLIENIPKIILNKIDQLLGGKVSKDQWDT